MEVSPKLYQLKLIKNIKEFPLCFNDYLDNIKIDGTNIDIKYILAWSQVLNQLHYYCVMINNIPQNIDQLFDLDGEIQDYKFYEPRLIILRSTLSEKGYDQVRKYIMADDCISYLEFVIYGVFPVPNRSWYIENFEYRHTNIIKHNNHFQNLYDDDYIVRLREEFENLKLNKNRDY